MSQQSTAPHLFALSASETDVESDRSEACVMKAAEGELEKITRDTIIIDYTKI